MARHPHSRGEGGAGCLHLDLPLECWNQPVLGRLSLSGLDSALILLIEVEIEISGDQGTETGQQFL